MKRVIIIVGPNGAGKTTFATEFLPNEGGCLNFVNADLIARGLAPFNEQTAAVRAARIMLWEIDEYVQGGESFAFETTLSGRAYARQIQEWRNAEYVVKLWFLKLPDVAMAIRRVAQRVAEGGHDIPEHVIRRRFAAGLANRGSLYKPTVDSWIVYDNSGEVPVVIDEGKVE